LVKPLKIMKIIELDTMWHYLKWNYSLLGRNLKGWIRKRKKLFKMHFTPMHQLVEIVILYLKRKAEIWYKGLLSGGNDLAN